MTTSIDRLRVVIIINSQQPTLKASITTNDDSMQRPRQPLLSRFEDQTFLRIKNAVSVKTERASLRPVYICTNTYIAIRRVCACVWSQIIGRNTFRRLGRDYWLRHAAALTVRGAAGSDAGRGRLRSDTGASAPWRPRLTGLLGGGWRVDGVGLGRWR